MSEMAPKPEDSKVHLRSDDTFNIQLHNCCSRWESVMTINEYNESTLSDANVSNIYFHYVMKPKLVSAHQLYLLCIVYQVCVFV